MSTDLASFFQKKFEEKHPSLPDVLRIEKAISVLFKKHDGQIRRSGEDYLVHPIEVALLLLEWNQKPTIITAGILHDIVEDSEVTIQDIEFEFGTEVSFFVWAVTNNTISQNTTNKAISLLCVSSESLVLKLADRVCNMRTLDAMPREKQIQKSHETLALYVPIARHLQMFDVAEELKALAHRFLQAE